MKSFKIEKIEKSTYSGKVYNLELKTNDKTNDDLFWVCNGIVVHNCFPKDINALMYLAKSYNIDPTVMSAAWKKNLEVRPQEDRDWELQIGRAVSRRKE